MEEKYHHKDTMFWVGFLHSHEESFHKLLLVNKWISGQVNQWTSVYLSIVQCTSIIMHRPSFFCMFALTTRRHPGNMEQYIAIEGIIGAGKTSLAKRLAADTGSSLILEQFEDNSFLPRFYEEPERYAFPLELSFLADRYQQLKEHFAQPDLFMPVTVADYTIYKSVVFAGQTLKDPELMLYKRMFSIMAPTIPKPELLVYLFLPSEKAKQYITGRGRSYEQNISVDYLEKIQKGYLEFIKQHTNWRILFVDTSDLDFVWREGDYEWLSGMIQKSYPPGITRIRK
jgi:deoxyguanosine kinase